MKINLSKQQYATLLKLLQYGYWVEDSGSLEGASQKTFELEQYLLSLAGEFESNQVIHNAEHELYELNEENAKRLQESIAAYEEMVFWDKLAYYMAQKDIKESLDGKANLEEVTHQLIEREKFYHDHFAEHGTAFLKLQK
ncbi:hypothetical protein ACFVHQ_09470 [Actinomycetes bacterium NPDC127524]